MKPQVEFRGDIGQSRERVHYATTGRSRRANEEERVSARPRISGDQVL